ncbi:hypothetical protein [Streptomyces sp. NPDC005760]|uniref:hypothetical protein n=1 Tax=Streptomyces sp. NPDC005760 TaxID=3156718 RepID=UPI0033E49277
MITAAPAESMSVCEFCGAPGRARTRNDDPYGWRKAVCDTCQPAWSTHRLMIIPGVVRVRDR